MVRLEQFKDVWGKIEIGEERTLADLHLVIQELFDWDDDHLYSFFMDNKYWGKGEKYSTFGNEEDFVRDPNEKKANEKQISKLKLSPGSKFKYIFDYGDEWRCQIAVEDIKEGSSHGCKIIEKHGNPPPQYPVCDE